MFPSLAKVTHFSFVFKWTSYLLSFQILNSKVSLFISYQFCKGTGPQADNVSDKGALEIEMS